MKIEVELDPAAVNRLEEAKRILDEQVKRPKPRTLESTYRELAEMGYALTICGEGFVKVPVRGTIR